MRALQVLVFVGIGAIAGAPEAVFELFGYDLADDSDRAKMAEALGDIIGFGIYSNRPPVAVEVGEVAPATR